MKADAAAARRQMELQYRRLQAAGCASPSTVDGKLIRPLLCMAGARAVGAPEDGAFWSAAAALQLAHEASLIHDDVIDGATVRRSGPTLVASRGVAAALVEGDHQLTTAYRLAAATGSPAFMAAFARAVERTVAGEKLQGRSRGALDEATYRRIAGGKSGELLGCALAAGALTHGTPGAAMLHALGHRLGTLYQMVDDLLDYCPDANTGKPPFADFRRRSWTWPLPDLGISFDDDVVEAALRCATPDAHGISPLRRCLNRLDREADVVGVAIAAILPDDEIATGLVREWLDRATAAVETAEEDAARRRLRSLIEVRVPLPGELASYFRRNSLSFSFAARLFPRSVRARIERVYAFCRVTDDIADDATIPAAERRDCMDVWCSLARRAWSGDHTGIGLLDGAAADARACGVPFEYVHELTEGMRMDLDGVRYATVADLRLYSFRVAGVVGQWVTRLCGVTDPALLERAAALGHAMQLTNILRDVGDDLDAGRVYLPGDQMRRFGLDESWLRRYRDGRPIDDDYRALMEVLMARADADYGSALEAAAHLPAFFRRPVVVAAHVYRGIHDEIRASGYDNLTLRARTSTATKMRLAAQALRGAGIEDPAAVRLRPAADGRGVRAMAAVSVTGSEAMLTASEPGNGAPRSRRTRE